MPPQSYYELMAEYNLWMNRKLYAVCEKIPDAARREDRGAFFKSIHNTLNHLMFADTAWMKRFTQKNYSLKSPDQNLYDNFEELKNARETLDQDILNWAANVSEEWLKKPLRVESIIYQRTWVLPAYIFVTQFFNHQTHHRGQLTTLLSQMGYDYGVTDIPWMENLED